MRVYAYGERRIPDSTIVFYRPENQDMWCLGEYQDYNNKILTYAIFNNYDPRNLSHAHVRSHSYFDYWGEFNPDQLEWFDSKDVSPDQQEYVIGYDGHQYSLCRYFKRTDIFYGGFFIQFPKENNSITMEFAVDKWAKLPEYIRNWKK